MRRCCLNAEPARRFLEVGNPLDNGLGVGAVGALGVRSLISPMRLVRLGWRSRSSSSSDKSRTKRSPGMAIVKKAAKSGKIKQEAEKQSNAKLWLC